MRYALPKTNHDIYQFVFLNNLSYLTFVYSGTRNVMSLSHMVSCDIHLSMTVLNDFPTALIIAAKRITIAYKMVVIR